MSEEEQVRLTLRLPKGLRDWLRSSARPERRSLNDQIVYLLESIQLGRYKPAP